MGNMTNRAQSFPEAGRSAFHELERSLCDHPDDPNLLQAYYREAVADQKVNQARTTLTKLQHRHPRNHHIRKRFIALCLLQKDYRSAMEAIETLVAFTSPDDALIDSALAVRSHLEPNAIGAKTSAEKSISLSMIVRDEQTYLGPCLNSIKNLADEIIVVDTGSVDRSADIARIYGARVYEFNWCEDFAAARNDSLEKANGDWVLILDADEIIAPEDLVALKQILRGDVHHPKAYSFVTRNYLNQANAMQWQVNDRQYPQQETGMGWFPTKKVRLFPRLKEIRFEYPVHELVEHTIETAGIPIELCRIPIHHYGHLNEERNQRKAHKYFELGYAKLEQIGDDKAALRELAVQAGQLEYWPQAIELWNRFLEIYPNYGEAYANIAGAYWQMGRYTQGVAFSKQAINADPDLKEGHYNLAVNRLMTEKPQEAVDIMQNLLQDDPNYLSAKFMLAAALSITGDDRQRRSIFDALKKELSDHVLTIAIQDLCEKFVASGLAHYAELLKQTVV